MMRPAQRIIALTAEAFTLVLVLAQALAPPHYPRSVTDHVGRSVPVPHKIEKVYATTESGSLLVYALDPELLLGWNVDPSPTWEFVLGNKSRALPILGSWDKVYKTIHLDHIAALQPDLVLHVAVPDLPTLDLVEQVEQELGIPTIVVDGSLEAIPKTLRWLGKLLGRDVRGGILAMYADNTLARLTSFREGLSGSPARTYVVGNTGKVDLADAFRLAGLREAGLNQNPIHMVLIVPDPILDLRWEMRKNPPLEISGLVAEGKVYQIPTVPTNWLTPGSLFRLLGVEWLAQAAYPELYTEDLPEKFAEFMEVFYEVRLPEKVAEATLKGP